MANIPPNAKYPDAIALAYDETNMKVTCVYNDHSLYVWDVKDIKRVRVISYFFLFISNQSNMFLIRWENQIPFYFIQRVFGE